MYWVRSNVKTKFGVTINVYGVTPAGSMPPLPVVIVCENTVLVLPDGLVGSNVSDLEFEAHI